MTLIMPVIHNNPLTLYLRIWTSPESLSGSGGLIYCQSLFLSLSLLALFWFISFSLFSYFIRLCPIVHSFLFVVCSLVCCVYQSTPEYTPAYMHQPLYRVLWLSPLCTVQNTHKKATWPRSPRPCPLPRARHPTSSTRNTRGPSLSWSIASSCPWPLSRWPCGRGRECLLWGISGLMIVCALQMDMMCRACWLWLGRFDDFLVDSFDCYDGCYVG